MSELTNLTIKTVDDAFATVTSFTLKPMRSRNGVFEFQGRDVSDTVLDMSNVSSYATASVRPGRAADYINNVSRVKRKVTVKLRLPISVPGEDGDIIDYIDIESVVSAPVESDSDQLTTAMVNLNDLILSNDCLKDMVLNGNEPF
jgi:hypothetical protein